MNISILTTRLENRVMCVPEGSEWDERAAMAEVANSVAAEAAVDDTPPAVLLVLPINTTLLPAIASQHITIAHTESARELRGGSGRGRGNGRLA